MSISGLFLNYIILECKLCFEEEKARGSLRTSTHQSPIVFGAATLQSPHSNDSEHVTTLPFGVSPGDQLSSDFPEIVTSGPLGCSISIGNVPACVPKAAGACAAGACPAPLGRFMLPKYIVKVL